MNALRALFLIMAIIILLGIWLTGFANVHWFLYVPPAMLAFAGITGICPGLMILRKIGLKDKPL